MESIFKRSAAQNVESSLEELTRIIVVTIILTPSKPCNSIFRDSDYDSIKNFWQYLFGWHWEYGWKDIPKVYACVLAPPPPHSPTPTPHPQTLESL